MEVKKEAEMENTAESPTPIPSLEGNKGWEGELYDLERMNFLSWYRDATVEEIAIARRNNAEKLDALTRKYEAEINLMEIIMPPRRDTERRVHTGNAHE
jgi:hypothetical protein